MNFDDAIYQGVAEVLVDVVDATRAQRRGGEVRHEGGASGFGLRTMPRKRYGSGLETWHSDLGRRDRADWSNTF
jgi:hypothetical protein